MQQAHAVGAWRLLMVVLTLAVLIGLPFFLWGEGFAAEIGRDGLAGWLRGYSGMAWLVAVGLLMSDLALPVPTTMVIAALGVIYGPIIGGAIALLGTSAAALSGYAIGRLLGRPVLLSLLGADALEAGERLFARSGGWIVAASRWLPILSEVVSCLAGLARMRLAGFVIALLCGLVPLSFLVAALGHVGADRPVLTLAFTAIAPLPLWFVARRLMRHSEAG